MVHKSMDSLSRSLHCVASGNRSCMHCMTCDLLHSNLKEHNTHCLTGTTLVLDETCLTDAIYGLQRFQDACAVG